MNGFEQRSGVHDLKRFPRKSDIITEQKRIEDWILDPECIRSLLEDTGVSVCMIDIKGRFMYVNNQLANLLGYPVEELRGRSFRDFLHPNDTRTIMRLFANIILLRRNPKQLEFRIMRKDGTFCHLLSKPTRFKIDGKTVGFQAIMVDISERKKAEKKLKESEEKFRTLAEESPSMIFIYGNGRVLYANKQCEEKMGYRREELYSPDSDAFSVVAPELKRMGMENLSKHLKNEQTGSYEFRLTTKYGETLDVIVAARSVQFEGGTAVLGMITDVTGRKRAQERIEALARYPLENPNPVLRISKDGIILDANPASEPLLQSWDCKVGGEAPEYWRDVIAEVFANQRLRNIEISLREKSLLITVVPVKNASYVNLYGRDITDRKKIEESLLESEERYRVLVESSPNFVTIIQDGILKYVNRPGCERVGRTLEELTSPSFNFIEEVVAKDCRGVVRKNMEKRLRGEALSAYEIRLLAADGSEIPVMVTGQQILYRGKPADEVILVDITERKKMEDELRRYSEQLEEMVEQRTSALQKSEKELERNLLLNRLLMDTMPSPAMLIRRDRTVMAANKAARDIGARVGEACWQSFGKSQFVRGDEKKCWFCMADEAMRDRAIKDCEVEAFGRLWNTGWVPAGEETFLQYFIDITEGRKMEKIKDRFMSAVTHELRTPLVSIKGYTDYISDGMSGPVSGAVMENVEVVKRNADRLLNLTNDLLDLQRVQAGRLQLDLQTLQIIEVIDGALKDVKPMIEQKRQTLKLEAPKTSPPIRGDPIRLNQVMINLLSNAVKFTPEGGTITLRVSEEDDSINVQLSDRGIGIRREDIERVFEPFSAIQKQSWVKGTGLGLSVTKTLVEAHGGKIWAGSPGEGKGATFTFTLPKWKEVN
ncbi:MAG: PAS domain-containing sensor histidine kinase [archaeon]